MISAISIFITSLALYMGTLKGAHLLHNLLLVNIIRAPCTSFYDVTPVGRILNRFSKDVDTLDNVLPMTLRGWLTCFFAVLNFFIVITIIVGIRQHKRQLYLNLLVTNIFFLKALIKHYIINSSMCVDYSIHFEMYRYVLFLVANLGFDLRLFVHF